MQNKHPEVLKQVATMDLSDVIADPLVRLQRKYYLLWVPLLWLALPTALPVYLWGESPFASFILCVIARYTISLHVIWLVNSWAHLFGARPYNEKLALVEATSIRHLVIGEGKLEIFSVHFFFIWTHLYYFIGFHNYHLAFPGDYSASEFVPADVFNPATLLIDCFASIGWVWNLKKADPELVQKIASKKGDRKGVQRYKQGRKHIEWSGGLVAMLAPIWIGLLLKYVLIYFFC